MDKQSLSELEIKKIITVFFFYRRFIELDKLLYLAEHGALSRQFTDDIDAHNIFFDEVSRVIARNLMQDNHDVPLLPREEYDRIMLILYDRICQVEDWRFDHEYRLATTKFFGEVLCNENGEKADIAAQMIPHDVDTYDQYWSMVFAIFEFAKEREVLLEELADDVDATDEISRRLFTKEQYIDVQKRQMLNYFFPKKLMEQIIAPLIDESKNFTGIPLEMPPNLTIMLESKFAVECRNLERYYGRYIDQEVERIYS